MQKNKTIKILSEEHNKLLNQLEDSECPLMTEVIIQGVNKVKAIDFVLNLLKINNIDLDNERDKILTHFKETNFQGMPIDIIQTVNRLQVLFYTKTLFEMEDEDDTSN